VTIEWDEFIESLESPSREWASSVNHRALSQLVGDERERAIQLRLSIGSPRISRALGVLPDPRVCSALQAHLPEATARARARTRLRRRDRW
jgi:hypothetical protein